MQKRLSDAPKAKQAKQAVQGSGTTSQGNLCSRNISGKKLGGGDLGRFKRRGVFVEFTCRVT